MNNSMIPWLWDLLTHLTSQDAALRRPAQRMHFRSVFPFGTNAVSESIIPKLHAEIRLEKYLRW
jgi:hypothetical protein